MTIEVQRISVEDAEDDLHRHLSHCSDCAVDPDAPHVLAAMKSLCPDGQALRAAYVAAIVEEAF